MFGWTTDLDGCNLNFGNHSWSHILIRWTATTSSWIDYDWTSPRSYINLPWLLSHRDTPHQKSNPFFLQKKNNFDLSQRHTFGNLPKWPDHSGLGIIVNCPGIMQLGTWGEFCLADFWRESPGFRWVFQWKKLTLIYASPRAVIDGWWKHLQHFCCEKWFLIGWRILGEKKRKWSVIQLTILF